jgi:hypothetical protein
LLLNGQEQGVKCIGDLLDRWRVLARGRVWVDELGAKTAKDVADRHGVGPGLLPYGLLLEAKVGGQLVCLADVIEQGTGVRLLAERNSG